MSPDDIRYRRCAANVDGPWQDLGIESGLIQRCREAWSIPFAE